MAFKRTKKKTRKERRDRGLVCESSAKICPSRKPQTRTAIHTQRTKRWTREHWPIEACTHARRNHHPNSRFLRKSFGVLVFFKHTSIRKEKRSFPTPLVFGTTERHLQSKEDSVYLKIKREPSQNRKENPCESPTFFPYAKKAFKLCRPIGRLPIISP